MKIIRRLTYIIFFVLALGLTAYAADSGMQTQDPGSGMSSSRSEGVLNINTASVDEFRLLPGINEQLARNIVDYRNANGPFRSVNELLNVRGMTRQQLSVIQKHLVLQGKTTYQPRNF